MECSGEEALNRSIAPTTETTLTCVYMSRLLPPSFPAGPPESPGSDRPLGPVDGDEALAKQLQQEMDREAMQVRAADLMDGGLFFCHVCHKELTHMTPEGRTQHVNRCAPHLCFFVLLQDSSLSESMTNMQSC